MLLVCSSKYFYILNFDIPWYHELKYLIIFFKSTKSLTTVHFFEVLWNLFFSSGVVPTSWWLCQKVQHGPGHCTSFLIAYAFDSGGAHCSNLFLKCDISIIVLSNASHFFFENSASENVGKKTKKRFSWFTYFYADVVCNWRTFIATCFSEVDKINVKI